MGRKMTTSLDRGAEIAYTCGLKHTGGEDVKLRVRTLRAQSVLTSAFLQPLSSPLQSRKSFWLPLLR